MTGCSRRTKAGQPCNGRLVKWSRSEVADPQSCRAHLTKDECRELAEIQARCEADSPFRWDRAAQILAGDPACWAWPPLTERDYETYRERWAQYPRLLEGETYLALILGEWHQGRCAVCGTGKGPFVQDHDHRTGLIRGHLCQSCNSLEGGNRAPNTVFARYRQKNPANILGISLRYWNSFTGKEAVPQPDLPDPDRWEDNALKGVL